VSASLEAWRLGPHVAKTGSKERQWKRKERLTHHTIYVYIYTYIYMIYAGNNGLNKRKEEEQRQFCLSLFLFSSTLCMFNQCGELKHNIETKDTGKNTNTLNKLKS
jgi:hypothetical protein